MKKCLVAACLWIGLVVTSEALATTLYVVSVGYSDAQVVINGNLVRTLGIGESSPEGVILKSIESNVAVFEVDGKVLRLSLGQSTNSKVILRIGPDGHARTTASINGVPLAALVDTGATTVVISSATASRLGINYRNGRQQVGQTANGTVMSYLITLSRVQVGDVLITNVACNVMEGAQIAPDLEVLIGNSFLNQVQMRRTGNTMVLTRTNGL